jgi:hypothetical protein
MGKPLFILAGTTVLLWGLAAYPAWSIGGPEQLAQSAAAMLICLLPALFTLYLARRSLGASFETQLAAILGGTGLRMFIVLGIGFVCYLSVEELRATSFWLWLMGFYLLTLCVEVALLVGSLGKQAGAASCSTQTGGPA